MHQSNRFRAHSGFSLLQLVITIAIAAALALVAVPSFASLLSRTQVSTHSNMIVESLSLARSQAIATQQKVHLCRLDDIDISDCAVGHSYANDWSSGWLVFVDSNNNNNFDSSDQLLQTVQLANKVNIVFNQRGRLRFFPDGRARSAGFYLCDPQQQAYRHIFLLHSGRARVNDSLSANHQRICENLSN